MQSSRYPAARRVDGAKLYTCATHTTRIPLYPGVEAPFNSRVDRQGRDAIGSVRTLDADQTGGGASDLFRENRNATNKELVVAPRTPLHVARSARRCYHRAASERQHRTRSRFNVHPS